MVFVSFNRDALLAELGTDTLMQKFYANDRKWLLDQGYAQFVSVEDWDKAMSNLARGGEDNSGAGLVGNSTNLINTEAKPKYSDELYPFDVTITLANEYGAKASEVLYGVELLNEGTGYSVDAPTSERAYTFICRSVDTMRPISEDAKGFITTTW